MISDILPRYQEVANGSKKAFTVPFDTLDSSYINVYLNNTKQSSGYTVSNKVVTFTSAPANGTVVTVTRVVPIEWEQEVLGAINQDSLNKIFTKLVAQMQTLKEEVSRAVKTDVTDTESGNDHFLELLEDAIDSLELANTKLEQVIASGTQALSDIDSAKTGALTQIESKVDEAEGWAEKAEEYAESVNPENFDHLKGKISNCILEIPQKITAEIKDNTLTLKSGSSMWYPNGNTYSEVSNSNDLTLDLPTTAGRFVICMSFAGSSLFARNILNCVSGSGVTTTGGFAFDTDAKTIINYSGTGQAGGRYCAPFCLIDVDSNGVASFAKDSKGRDMIFNGCGYIGHHVFVYPGVKCLAPDGLNTDGTMKSNEYTTASLLIVELRTSENAVTIGGNNTIQRRGRYRITQENDGQNGFQYIEPLNLPIFNVTYVRNETPIVLFSMSDSTTVSSFDIQQPVRLATTEMLDKVQDQVDTKQDTLVSGTNIKTINSTTVLGSGNFTLADQSLSNLDSTGQMVVDSQNGTISNCILEIPQDIKLELNDGTPTLKAGSKVYVPNGFNGTKPKFNEVTIANDISNFGNAIKSFAITDGSSLLWSSNVIVFSGETAPTNPTNGYIWYDTTNNLIKRYSTSSSAWIDGFSLPVALLNPNATSSTTITEMQVFNGCGYIGHHIFTYPQTRYLSGNGYEDGKLASYDNTLNSLTISEMSTTTHTGYDNVLVVRGNNNTVSGSSFWRTVKSYNELLPQSARLQFVEDDNIAYAYTSGNYVAQSRIYLCTYAYDGTTVTKFDIRQPVRLSTTEMLDKVQDQVDTKQDTLVSGTNIKTINSTTVLGSGNFTLADQSLSNLDSTGQMVVDSQNGTISNCILEIPQNIKVTLENNVLTLKAGSILVLANGATYTTVQLANDLSRDISTIVLADNNEYIVICSATQVFSPIPLSRCASGNTLPANDDYTYYWYYKVDEKILYFKSPSDTTWRNVQASYPICILKRNSGEDISFAKDSNGNDMIFNGAGFIGHHAFVYPNPNAGLIGIGLNEGKLLSSKAVQNSLSIIEMSSSSPANGYSKIIYYSQNGAYRFDNFREVDTLAERDSDTTNYRVQYVRETNKTYYHTNNGFDERQTVKLITYSYNGTTVTDFTICQPYEGARNLLTDDIEEEVATKANDSEVAKIASNNTFTGMNTFSGNSAEKLTVQHTDITKGTNPQNLYGSTFIRNVDANGETLGSLYNRIDTLGNVRLSLVSYSFNGDTNSQLAICYDADGTTYAIAPTPAISDDSNKIVTTEWFNDKLVLVNELPANPDSNVWYAIPEEE